MKPEIPRKARSAALWYALAGLVLLWAANLWLPKAAVETVPYSRFLQLLREQKIESVSIRPDRVEAVLKDPLPSGRTVVSAVRVDPELAKDLGQYGVTFTAVAGDGWLTNALSWAAPLIFFAVFWTFMLRTGNRGLGLSAIGRNRAKIYVERDIKATFADVAGVDEAKRELQEVVSFLKAPAAHARLGARMPKGILLIGPPGTGKTLMARAVAGEAGVPFFSISGSEFVEMFVGVGAARVRDLFEQAAAAAPCIIFIDELDALGRARGFGVVSGGNDEKEQTLNQLLVEMDGFDPRRGVVLLAATNRPEILDPALLRAGRFDRQVLLDRPDKAGRLAILKTHVRRLTLDPEANLETVAALTVGFSGADLATLANEAALAATRRGAGAVAQEDFTAAFERIVAGIEKHRRMNDHERRVVAHHEMGHALVAMSMPGADAVHKISIIPRGIGAIGYTLQRPAEDRYITSRQDLFDKLAVLLAGRMAEVLVFDELSTGAGDDLAKATDIARSMVMQFGMDEGLGQVVYEPPRQSLLDLKLPEGQRQFSEQTARKIDCAVRHLLDQAATRAKLILETNRALLDEGAALLLSRETLTEDGLRAFKDRIVGPGKPSGVPPKAVHDRLAAAANPGAREIGA